MDSDDKCKSIEDQKETGPNLQDRFLRMPKRGDSTTDDDKARNTPTRPDTSAPAACEILSLGTEVDKNEIKVEITTWGPSKKNTKAKVYPSKKPPGQHGDQVTQICKDYDSSTYKSAAKEDICLLGLDGCVPSMTFYRSKGATPAAAKLIKNLGKGGKPDNNSTIGSSCTKVESQVLHKVQGFPRKRFSTGHTQNKYENKFGTDRGRDQRTLPNEINNNVYSNRGSSARNDQTTTELSVGHNTRKDNIRRNCFKPESTDKIQSCRVSSAKVENKSAVNNISLLVKCKQPQPLQNLKEMLFPHLTTEKLPLNLIEHINDGTGDTQHCLLRLPSMRKAKLLQASLRNVCEIASAEIKDGREEISVNRGDTLNKLRLEIMEFHQQKMTEQDRKISNVQSQLEQVDLKKKKSRKVKFLPLDEYEAREGMRETLQSKKDDLQAHITEFTLQLTKIEQQIEQAKSIKFDNAFLKEISRIRTFYEIELERFTIGLPVYAKRSDIIQLVEENQVSLILGETGSGKSTQMAQYLYEGGLGKGIKIVCTQPRKIAAVSVAKRVAEEMKVDIGGLVGYSTGMTSRLSKETMVVYATDHILLNECIKDPLLHDYACIIIDEAHERTVQTDLLLGMLKRCLVHRPELRLIITSATIDPEPFVKYFNGCPVLRVSGRLFPVEVVFSSVTTSDKEFLNHAVQKVIEINEKEPAGDVLVFLTTPGETEKACDLLKQHPSSKDIVAFPLHGKLQAEDQQKAFSAPSKGKRKVLFATNIGETSLTIPGIIYVVDSGYAKQLTYNPVTDFSGLKVTRVSKSSADQRKGRAGRTDCGKCFRLYTSETFDEMDPINSPEILRVHLGQALLKLMALGVNNPAEFDFVQPPPKEAFEAAVSTLNEIGATEDGKLTPLGKKMSKVPMPPRMAKAVLLAIDAGMGLEMTVSLTMCTLSQSVFFRVGSAQEKELADKLKAKFCHKYGDMHTYLDLYREWFDIHEKNKSKWCVQNAVNAKSMRIARDAVKEFTSTMKNDININMHNHFNKEANPSHVDKSICQIIGQCFTANLCYFSGHSKIGYFITSSPDKSLAIHPSAALLVQGEMPKWVVYLQVLTTSQDFMLNVTRLEDELVQKMVENQLLKIKVDLMFLSTLEMREQVVKTIGKNLMRRLIGPRYTVLKKIEETIKSNVGTSVVLEANVKTSCIHLFCPAYCQEKALGILHKVIDTEKNFLQSDTLDIPLTPENPIRVLMGVGSVVIGVNLPGDYHKVYINDVPEDMDTPKINAIMEPYGEVYAIQPIHSPYSDIGRIAVTFRHHEAAAKVVAASKQGSLVLDVQPGMSQWGRMTFPFKLKFKWSRREKTGMGLIAFRGEYWSNLRLHFPNLRIGRSCEESCVLDIQWLRGESVTARFRGLRNSCSESDVRRSVVEKLDNIGVPFNEADISVVLFRKKAVGDDHHKEQDLKQFIEDSIGNQNFHCFLFQPKEKDYDYKGYINLADQKSMTSLLGRSTSFHMSPDNSIEFEKQFETSFLIRPEIYAVVHDRIQSKIKDFSDKTGREETFSWKITPMKNNCFALRMMSSSAALLTKAKDALGRYVFGTELSYSVDEYKVLVSPVGKKFLDGLRPKCIVLPNKRAHCLHLFADTDETLSEITKSVASFLRSAEYKEFELAGEGKPPGLLRALLVKYGAALKGLRANSGAVELDLNLKRHQLLFWGSPEAYDRIVKQVTEISSSLSADTAGQLRTIARQMEEKCPICLCPVENETAYNTELCNHAYCKECVTSLVGASIENKQIPIVCANMDCGTALSVTDIKNVLGDTMQKLQPLVRASLDVFVAQHSDMYHYCGTPDCPSVYRVTIEGIEFSCPVCGDSCCTSCHLRPGHKGLSCKQLENISRDEDYYLKEWLAADPKNRYRCPKCKSPIEKNGGCMHVTCTECKPHTHICWRCKETFKTSGETYSHVSGCTADGSTGGIFGD